MGYQTTVGSTVHLDFGVRNVPVPIQVQDVPGTFVLLTPNSYTGTNPPTVNLNSSSPAVWTKTIGQEGIATLQVPRGSYYMTCWKQTICYGKTTFLPTTSAQIYSGATVSPEAPPGGAPLSCPAITSCP
jgi:hypothetical protein